jgi:hypothetical protein
VKLALVQVHEDASRGVLANSFLTAEKGRSDFSVEPSPQACHFVAVQAEVKAGL